MPSINIVDETTKYTSIIRDFMPEPRRDYIVDGNVHIAALREDMESINSSIEVYNILTDLLADMADRINASAEVHARTKKRLIAEMSTVGKFVPDKNMKMVTHDVEKVNYIDGESTRMAINPDGPYINAIVVTNGDDVLSDGKVYYITSINRFAVRINGHLMLGNIGEIFTHGCTPYKIKTCSNGRSCRESNCTYYHPDAGDIRNFVSGSFSYHRRTEGISRKIGNRSTLAADIAKATKPEIELFQDQSIHDLLCHLAILDTTR